MSKPSAQIVNGMKKCSCCEQEKPLDRFSINRRASNGLCAKCKDCQKAYNDANKLRKADVGRAYRTSMGDALKDKKKAWILSNREWKRESNRRWTSANPEKAKQSLIDWRERNPGRAHILRKEWVVRNPERAAALSKESRIRNKHKIAERLAARRAALAKATPSWANKEKIRDYYKTADALGMWTGEWHHVDHIVPLRGKTVRGLHVESNLQILTQSENVRKSAKWWPDMPGGLHG